MFGFVKNIFEPLEELKKINVMNENLENFKNELRELLAKYNASLGCDVDGDTHGTISEIVVEFYQKGKGWKKHKLCNGAYIDKGDF